MSIGCANVKRELANTGDKPIYFVYITMDTNVKVDNDLELGFSADVRAQNWVIL